MIMWHYNTVNENKNHSHSHKKVILPYPAKINHVMPEGFTARMSKLTQSLKTVGLFVLGGLFLATGWQVGAQSAKDKDKKASNTDKKKDSKKDTKKGKKKTVLEKKWPENASGSA